MRKPLFRLLALLLALLFWIPSRAAVPADDRPQGWLGVILGGREAPSRGEDGTVPSSESPGVRVRGVFEGSPAEQARLRANDSIVAVDGAVVSGAPALMARLRSIEPGSNVTLSVRRGGRDLELSTVLGERPSGTDRLRMVIGWLGVEAIELPALLREHFGAPANAGILVSRVVEGSPAEDSGIRIGDVVYEADGKPVTSVGGLSRIATEAGVDNAIDIVLARDGARIVVGPRIVRAPDTLPR